MVFGDVNLRDNAGWNKKILGHATCCGGGWPYMHYFNQETGYGGAQYKKQTSDRICVELGCKSKKPCSEGSKDQCCVDDPKYMRKYVEDYAPSQSGTEKAEL